MRVKIKKEFNETIELLKEMYSDFKLKESGFVTPSAFVMVFKGEVEEINNRFKFSLFVGDHTEYVEVSVKVREFLLKKYFMKNMLVGGTFDEVFQKRLNRQKMEFEVIKDEK